MCGYSQIMYNSDLQQGVRPPIARGYVETLQSGSTNLIRLQFDKKEILYTYWFSYNTLT